MTMITPSYLGETIEYSSLHACRSTLEDPTVLVLLNENRSIPPATSIEVAEVSLASFDELLGDEPELLQ